MRVLLAFDKFKDCLTAQQACDSAAEALARTHPDWVVDRAGLADGGEGFAEILTRAVRGELRTESVAGPRGAPVAATYGLVPAAAIPDAARRMLGVSGAGGTIALIEMATASGLALLRPEERDPWHTSTTGTGQLIRSAAAAGASAIVLGVGGSATSDLGVGALSVLGAAPCAGDGKVLAAATPAAWAAIVALRGTPAALPPILIACDVTNPLLGPTGAAAVYGPQKGLRPADVAQFDAQAARVAALLCAHFGQPETLMNAPGAGAAGGIAFGLMVGTGARLLPGFDFVSRWLDLDSRIAAADVVVTGEGRFDESSLSGKGPGAVVARALAAGKRVHVFAGAIAARERRDGLALHAITPADMPLPVALRSARENLARAVAATFATGGGACGTSKV